MFVPLLGVKRTIGKQESTTRKVYKACIVSETKLYLLKVLTEQTL